MWPKSVEIKQSNPSHYAVLSNFDFVAKFTVKNLNKDFINAVRGGVTVL